MMKIHFYIRFYTHVGQTMAVMGNTDELGNNHAEQALQLTWLNNDFWYGTVQLDTHQHEKIQYKYLLLNDDGTHVMEWGDDRILYTTRLQGAEELQLIDTWNHAGEYENAFYTDPFQEILLAPNRTNFKVKQPKHYSHIFKVKAPLLAKHEILCLLGSGTVLSEWNTASPVMLERENGWWSVALELPKESFPLSYKYGIYNAKEKTFVKFEEGSNRLLHGDAQQQKLTILHDGFVHLPNTTWKGAGVSIPVFSLRSNRSLGTGEFTDLPLLVDWAHKTGLKLIQILPVNDTTATHTWMDTYPYAAVSAFALHPMYLNLEQVAGKKNASLLKPIKKKQKELNELPEIHYEEVMNCKLGVIKELFTLQREELLQDKDYLDFFKHHKHWLVPYAAFCYLRDKYGSSDPGQWKTHSVYDKTAIEKLVSPRNKHFHEVALHYFIQYHLHLQLKDAVEYAHKKGIILKGDIPIGVYRYGCDAWTEPELYHMDAQAGAPPDDFAVKGQNWGFPTYNWERMAEDGFEWWHRRFVQMADYFDAFRIDHILGFFRIWSIPLHAVEGILGHFVRAIPIHVNEFAQRGGWFDYRRFCTPYITDAVLWELFGPNGEKFKSYLQDTGTGVYELKPEYATQRQVEAHFAVLESSDEHAHLRQGLYDLISNVLLLEQPGSNGQEFHFRFGIENTASFRHLDGHLQQILKDLYVDYFYRRQNDFWMKESMKKLPALKQATNMLICGEDLGMVPACVPDVMKQLGILSLEIQRMPKDPSQEFFRLNNAPYLSVVTPSTHDMSTIRGWWEEDRVKTQRFFNNEMGQWGDAPYHCDGWINKAIVRQHLNSPAMWAIFQLQDLLGMDDAIRRSNPHEERINVPANPKNYWRYRMHIGLEQLLKEKDFNEELKEFVEAGGRS